MDGRVISQATVVAIGVTSEGDRQVLGVDVGPSEDRAFWTAFLRSLVKRGLTGVRLVISDAHEGLQQAISTVLTGSAWQRCRRDTQRPRHRLEILTPQQAEYRRAFSPGRKPPLPVTLDGRSGRPPGSRRRRTLIVLPRSRHYLLRELSRNQVSKKTLGARVVYTSHTSAVLHGRFGPGFPALSIRDT